MDPSKYTITPGPLDTPCHVWNGGLSKNGYARSSRNGKPGYAHAIAFADAGGVLRPGLEHDHRCRNRACVNPEHLQPVTRAVNTQRGLAAKLTEQDVIAIRRSTSTRVALAARYGVCKQTITDVRHRRTWKNIEEIHA